MSSTDNIDTKFEEIKIKFNSVCVTVNLCRKVSHVFGFHLFFVALRLRHDLPLKFQFKSVTTSAIKL